MAENNHEEFVQLMSLHQRHIWWLINTLLPAASDADDVLQETSLVLWRKWNEFDRDRDFVSWAIGIARLQVFRYVREHRAQRRHLDENVLGEIAAAAEQRIHDMARVETRLQALRACLGDLGQEERQIVEGRYLKLQSTKELAEAVHKPLASIYTSLRRARLRLEECVTRKLAASEAT